MFFVKFLSRLIVHATVHYSIHVAGGLLVDANVTSAIEILRYFLWMKMTYDYLVFVCEFYEWIISKIQRR